MLKKINALVAVMILLGSLLAQADVLGDSYNQVDSAMVIEVKEYQPTILVSSLIEEQDVPIMAVLGAARTSAVTTPTNLKVSVKLLEQSVASAEKAKDEEEEIEEAMGETTKEENEDTSVKVGTVSTKEGTPANVKKDYFKSADFTPNPNPTLDELGYLTIWLKQIPKEVDVPDSIRLDFRATINYEGSTNLLETGTSDSIVLRKTSLTEFKENRENYRVLGGNAYLRLSSISDTKASIEVYDSNLEKKKTLSVALEEGATSSSYSYGTGDYQNFRLQVNDFAGEQDYYVVVFQVDEKYVVFFISQDKKKIYRIEFEKDELSNVLTSGDFVNDLIELIRDKSGESSDDFKLFTYLDEDAGFKEVYNNWEIDLSESSFVETKDSNKNTVPIYVNVKNSDIDDFYFTTSSPLNNFGTILGGCGTGGGPTEITPYAGDLEKFKNKKHACSKITENPSEIEELKKITLVKVAASSISRSAWIKIGDDSELYSVGDVINCNDNSYEITEVTSSAVKTVYNTDKIKTFSKGNSYSCGNNEKLQVTDITSSDYIDIAIIPGTKEFTTYSDFSIYVPIEKRAIDLAPDDLSKKINSTLDTIERLNGTINSLETLVEGWTKVCLITAAVFTVTSFFSGLGKKKTDDSGSSGGAPVVAGGGSLSTQYKPQYYEDSSSKWVSIEEACTIRGANNINLKVEIYSDGYCAIICDSSNSDSKKIEGLSAEDCSRFKVDTNVDKVKNPYLSVSNSYSNPVSNVGEWSSLGNAANQIDISNDKKVLRVPITSKTKNTIYNVVKNTCPDYKKITDGRGDAMYLEVNLKENVWSIKHVGTDGIKGKNSNGQSDDYVVCSGLLAASQKIKSYADNIISQVESGKKDNIKIGSGNFKISGRDITYDEEEVQCESVLSKAQCKILFNACDPVICPASRCNMGGRYNIEKARGISVAQSGLIGSILLCLPNIKEGIIMPVCLSGILSSLKMIRSHLEGYVSCLRAAQIDEKSIGICDKVRSIFLCEILWREIVMFFDLQGKGIVGSIFGKASGGGEYFSGGISKGKETINYFTNTYAKHIFASYKGGSKEIGTEICKSAIYGKVPWYGTIVGETSSVLDVAQFTAYFEEHPYSTIGGLQSRYQVYYHIYAGGSTANYNVYLKKDGSTKSIASGSIEANKNVDETKDLIAASGYQQICVVLNGQEYCAVGKIVSTSLAAQTINDYIMKSSLNNEIITAEQCRADSSGYIASASVTKQCAKVNPGTGKDEEDRWQAVGECWEKSDKTGEYYGKCWADLGAYKQNNPSAYVETFEDLCKNNNGYLCGKNEKCVGTVLSSDEVSGVTYTCCRNACEVDTAAVAADTALDTAGFEVSSALGVSELYNKINELDEGINPFNNPGIAEEFSGVKRKIEEEEDSIAKKEKLATYYYLRIIAYLKYGDCDKAKTEFSNHRDEIEEGGRLEQVLATINTKCLELKSVKIDSKSFDVATTVKKVEPGNYEKISVTFSGTVDCSKIELVISNTFNNNMVIGSTFLTADKISNTCVFENDYIVSGDSTEIKVKYNDNELADVILLNKEEGLEESKVKLCGAEYTATGAADPTKVTCYIESLNEKCSNYLIEGYNVLLKEEKVCDESTNPNPCKPTGSSKCEVVTGVTFII